MQKKIISGKKGLFMAKKLLLFLLITLLSVTLVVIFGIKLFRTYHSTPEKAIKFYISIRNGPWAANRVTITEGSYYGDEK